MDNETTHWYHYALAAGLFLLLALDWEHTLTLWGF